MKFYLTTPIYYVNGNPHIGTAYTTIVADVLARYHRLRGDDVFFLTGTDENSQKNVEASEKQSIDVQTYVDQMSVCWQNTFRDLGITYDRFIRTTEGEHKKAVDKFWNAVAATGDIYLGDYDGLYCVGCEDFKQQSDLHDGKCPLHLKEPTVIKEKNYFFRLSKYRDALLSHIAANPDFINPEERRNEITSYIKNFMTDVSISRETATWGISVPTDSTHVIYVWFDALINYLTGVGYGSDEAQFARYWPADIHLVGKDIIKFHCALWPAMLLSAGLPLPKHIYAHGFFTVNGVKISKSLGNAIDPLEIIQQYGNDTLRFFLLREIPFGSDGDFSFSRMTERYNGDLANELGNLLHRVLSMIEKYTEGKVPAATQGSLNDTWSAYEKSLSTLRFHDALDAIWRVLRDANKTIDDEKPWVLATNNTARLAEVLYTLLEQLRHVAWLISPIMPETSQKIFAQLGIVENESKKTWDDAKIWGGMKEGAMIAKGTPLFVKNNYVNR